MSDLPPDAIHPLVLPEWSAWLADHYRTSKGVWLVTFKKATGRPRVEYEEAVEEALCWAWIDSVSRSLDADRGMLWFSPRKKGSGWSRTNKVRLEKLLAENRLSAHALEGVEAAKRDGKLVQARRLRKPGRTRRSAGRAGEVSRRRTLFRGLPSRGEAAAVGMDRPGENPRNPGPADRRNGPGGPEQREGQPLEEKGEFIMKDECDGAYDRRVSG